MRDALHLLLLHMKLRDLTAGRRCLHSTMLRLLTRLYDVNEGSIEFDGVDVRELRQAALRSAVAVVPQVRTAAWHSCP